MGLKIGITILNFKMINYIELKIKLLLKKCPHTSEQFKETIKQILLNAPNLDIQNIDVKIEVVALGDNNGK